MDLLQLRTKLRRQVGNPTSGDVTDSLLNEQINQAYKDVADRFRFHRNRKLCTFSTVVGQAEYGLPADLLSIIRVRDTTNGVRLIKSDSKRDAALDVATMDNRGKPTHYSRYRTWVTLDPVPDGIYTIELFYKGNIVDLVSDSDTPVLPDTWHHGILLMAKYHYYIDQPDAPKAQHAMGAFNDWATNKPSEVDEEKSDFDSGVEIPTLSHSTKARLDFDHSD